ncbi:HEAT repeat domain-containing protein [Cognatiyoonia sp. IB215446]|uniref:HEAT repeat domain-containing protein n=1 Tax=Cognatiyoonia sp. IB215446 TaxID=3097355 RepID=UPI002A10C7A6|nr:HEAT repeat domain-containing protein [Cognatiyoonia sp. IB215446]MDX8346499.1 HEAT repeat domain-containing protein [Cognatiyoonia sp. IB215446]
MDLITQLRAWDGKTIATLQAVVDDLTVADYPDLLRACHDEDEVTARAASWVLKAACERGASIPYPAELLSTDLHWEIALHLLQSVQHVAVDLPAEVIRPYLIHQKPIVRAWALDAYVRLGAPDAAEVLEKAADDPAASVRARARNLGKEKAQPVPPPRPS